MTCEPETSTTTRSARVWWGLGLVGVLILGIGVRVETLVRPHLRGDQRIYIALAFKLASSGVDDYNLRNVGLRPLSGNRVVFETIEGRGTILDQLERDGAPYLDVPLVQIPYGFPGILALSHRLLADGEPFMAFGAPKRVRLPTELARHQLYAVLPSFAFGVITIGLVYLLGMALYERRGIALTAAFLLAVSPIGILASQRVWADTMTAAFSLVSVLLYVTARKRERSTSSFAGGLCCGLATIAKPIGGFVAIAVALDHGLGRARELSSFRPIRAFLLDRYLMVFAIGVLLACGHWFWLVALEYGNPLYLESTRTQVDSDWFRLVSERPWYVYLLGIPSQNPLFALAYAAPLWLRWDSERTAATRLLLLWIGVFLVYFGVVHADFGKEHRWFLSAYSAYALLAAYVADRLRRALAARFGRRMAIAAVVVVLGLSLAWCVPMGLAAVYLDQHLLMIPW